MMMISLAEQAAGNVADTDQDFDPIGRLRAVLLERGPSTIYALSRRAGVPLDLARRVLRGEPFVPIVGGRYWLSDTNIDPLTVITSRRLARQQILDEQFEEANRGPASQSPATIAARTLVFLAAHGPTKYALIGRELDVRLDELADVLESDERFERSMRHEGAWALAGSEVPPVVHAPAPTGDDDEYVSRGTRRSRAKRFERDQRERRQKAGKPQPTRKRPHATHH